jgi:hypothetical protein
MKRHTLRRLDVMSKRALRNALVQWRTWACKAGLQFTRLACALPSDRGTQDRAIYSCLLAAVVLLAVLKHMEG